MMISILTLMLCLLADNYAYAKDGDRETDCNLFSGTRVHDTSYPSYDALQCPYITNTDYNCKAYGRPDSVYEKWRWQPDDCDIPRFSAKGILERLRGNTLMFVGDSISHNQFISLSCLIYTEFPNTIVPSNKTIVTLKYTEYNVSIEFVWDPYLVDLQNNEGKRVLHVDQIQNKAINWVGADVLVFESSKWWPDVLGPQRWDIIMEGNQKYTDMDPKVAYRKAITTWSKWISSNLNTQTLVFFRGISFSHNYNKERSCEDEKPIQDPSYDPQPTFHAKIVQEGLSTTSFPVKFFNISRNSAFRKDGHPSLYTKCNDERQDCSHWCLPGVTDSWNQLLYAILLLAQS